MVGNANLQWIDGVNLSTTKLIQSEVTDRRRQIRAHTEDSGTRA
jgi:hypothetical protein